MFKKIDKKNFSQREENILDFWDQNNIFLTSLKNRKDAPLFTFYDGPPFATGLPHYGHLLAGTIKDVIPRYKTMKGYYVPRRFGWDCHGLPVESEIEKSHNLTGADSIEKYGIGKFNEECRKIVLRYSKEWKSSVKRMGRWVDFEQTYRTMDPSFMESVWWAFKELFEKGLVYEGFKVMPFSAKLGTPLSNFEATQNYQDVDDPSLTVSFPLEEEPETSLLIWTTTPWTLISNLAISVGKEITYVKLHDKQANKNYILAKDRLQAYYKDKDSYTTLDTFLGESLENKRYTPLFPYFAKNKDKGAFRCLLADFISTEDGTGLVHTAPAFGEDDFYTCQKANIPVECPVDQNGKFTDQIPEYKGIFVKDADKAIIKRIKSLGQLVKQETCRHRYPFCWRSDTPLIYRAMNTWFVSVEKIKDQIINSNSSIHWTPGHIKEGRFGKWLEGARDWAISRNRYWGTPIPLWQAEDGEIHVIGSIQELEDLTGTKITDLHRHYIDQLTFEKNGKTFRRIPEVFDCWFESGSMPYAQNHYPFNNKELFEKNFPADFIAEGLDQTRGWFYTLTILSTALFNKPAFKNVIVNGIILTEDGKKMSKRLKNYPDPLKVAHQYGADAIRLYMLHSPAVKGDDLSFSEKGVELVLRQIILPLWNSYSFFITYARIYNWTPKSSNQNELVTPKAEIDQWILSLLNKLVSDVESAMDDYDLCAAVEPFVEFINQLTNWYIRRNRRRFWEEKDSLDRQEAFGTLYQVLLSLTKIAAPFIPFLSEEIYLNLRDKGENESKETTYSSNNPGSVHLCDFPRYSEKERNTHLEDSMKAVQKVVSLGHSLRKDHKLKVRQPLQAVHIISSNENLLSFLREQQHLIADELNVKNIIFEVNEEKFVQLKAKPNFRVLGKKVGKLMRAVQTKIGTFESSQLIDLMEGRDVIINIEDTSITLSPEDVEVERIVKDGLIATNANEITVALDTQLNEDLILEALARELVNKVNTMRRNADLHVSDRIDLTLKTTDKVKSSLKIWEKYVCQEVLAKNITFNSSDEKGEGDEWDLNGEITTIKMDVVKH